MNDLTNEEKIHGYYASIERSIFNDSPSQYLYDNMSSLKPLIQEKMTTEEDFQYSTVINKLNSNIDNEIVDKYVQSILPIIRRIQNLSIES
jgi:hypothetical protein